MRTLFGQYSLRSKYNAALNGSRKSIQTEASPASKNDNSKYIQPDISIYIPTIFTLDVSLSLPLLAHPFIFLSFHLTHTHTLFLCHASTHAMTTYSIYCALFSIISCLMSFGWKTIKVTYCEWNVLHQPRFSNDNVCVCVYTHFVRWKWKSIAVDCVQSQIGWKFS